MRIRLQDEAIIAANLDDLVTCPECCAKLCIDKNVKFYKCSCGRQQCRNCPRLYDEKHKDVPCSEVDKSNIQNELEPKLAEIAIRVCHKCNLKFVKDEGCNHIQCRCGAEQCYLCRQPVEGYDHFCECGWKEKSGNCPNCFKSCPLWGNPEERDRIQIDEVIAAFNATMKLTPVESFNLYIKNFGDELDDGKLFKLFEKYGKIISHAVMKHPDGKSKGFGFVAFADPDAAEAAIKDLHGYVLPKSKKKLFVTIAKKKEERETELSQSVNTYLQNLNSSVTEEVLQKYFENYGRIISVKILVDKNNKSKCCGFVRFADPEVAERAIKNLNGRTLKISRNLSIIKDKKRSGLQIRQKTIRDDCNLYIRNLDKSLNEDDLERAFQAFGNITSTRVCLYSILINNIRFRFCVKRMDLLEVSDLFASRIREMPLKQFGI